MPDSKTFYVNSCIHQFSVFSDIAEQTLNGLVSDKDFKPIPDDEMEYMDRLDEAVDNSLSTLFGGICGLGQVLAKASSFMDKEIVDSETLGNLGWLINGLGAMAENLCVLRDHIYILRTQQAGIKNEASHESH